MGLAWYKNPAGQGCSLSQFPAQYDTLVSFIQPNKWTKSAIIEEQESRTIYQNKKKKKTAELKQAHNIPNKPLYKIVQRRVQSPSKQFLTPLHVRIREYV